MKRYEVGIYYQPYSGGMGRLVHPGGGTTSVMTVETIRRGLTATRAFNVYRNRHGGIGNYKSPTGTMWNIENDLLMEGHAVLS